MFDLAIFFKYVVPQDSFWRECNIVRIGFLLEQSLCTIILTIPSKLMTNYSIFHIKDEDPCYL